MMQVAPVQTKAEEPIAVYRRTGSAQAFRALVDRHGPAVHAHCSRRLRDPAAAEDAAQAVFVLLARNAARVGEGAAVAGWLHATARYVCMASLRAEGRRERHELASARRRPEVYMPEELDDSGRPAWGEIGPMVDEALDGLRPADRSALVCRYLEGRPVAELARQMGVSHDAAKQRVSRALRRLRDALAKRGIGIPVVTPAFLEGMPTPPGLSAGLAERFASASAGDGPAHIVSLADGGLKTMLYSKLKLKLMWIAVTCAGLVLAVAPVIAVVNSGAESVATSSATSAIVPAATPVIAPAELQGVWNFEINGRSGTLVIRGAVAVWLTEQEYSPADIVKADTSTTPAQLDVVLRPEGTMGGQPHPKAGMKKEFVFAVSPDGALKLAESAPGSPRPAKLEASETVRVVTLHRVK